MAMYDSAIIQLDMIPQGTLHVVYGLRDPVLAIGKVFHEYRVPNLKIACLGMYIVILGLLLLLCMHGIR